MSPSSITVYPSSTWTVQVAATTNASVAPTVSLGSLPSGITSSTTFPLSVPSGGAAITFQSASTLAPGAYTLVINGQAGTAIASAKLAATVPSGTPPGFAFTEELFTEIGLSPGSSSQVQVGTRVVDGTASYQVQLSVSGLPSGITASLNPTTIPVGGTATLTIAASSSAAEGQNTSITVAGTASAAVPSASLSLLVDVTPPPGSLANNRTDYVSTEDTPYGAVYDSVHGQIFATNESWNRVDVISTATHTIVSHIPLPDPRGIDITQDGSTVWVATGSRQVFSISTTNLAVSRYMLPIGTTLSYWEGSGLLALSDGTVMLVTTGGTDAGTSGVLIWDPASNTISFPATPAPVVGSLFYRSGGGNRVYFLSNVGFYYDVPSKTFSAITTLPDTVLNGAVNQDGSRIAVCDAAGGAYMFDENFNIIGLLPTWGFGVPPFFEGGSVFSPDGLYLYQEALLNIPLIFKVDANTLSVLSVAPAMPMIPADTGLSPPYYVPDPFAVDPTGMVFGLEYWGVAFDDGAFAQNYSPAQPGSPIDLQNLYPYFGPLNGGTTSSGFSELFSLTPDVWYGANRGSAALTDNKLSITSPPATQPGPVNVKMLFPDGTEVFDPLAFSYGPSLQYAVLSGASPQGNAPGQVVGYGLPGDNGISGTLNVGGSAATLATPDIHGWPWAGTAFPSEVLSFTVPPGTPGWADITMTTPDGSWTLPKGVFYAEAVTDYNSPDTFSAVLYDKGRQQLYLSAGDHIDVFSLTSNQFVTPLTPPATGTSKQFAGMALTPDGTSLLATDAADGSLAVINPDNPSSAYAISIVAVYGGPGIVINPTYVAATSNNEAFVTGGGEFLVNLTTGVVTYAPQGPNACMGSYVSATGTGDKVAIGGSPPFCIYDVGTNTYTSNSGYQTYGAAFSADGNVAASEFVLTDSSANVVNRIARPDIYYSALGTNSAYPNLPEPLLNDPGSLYFMAYPNFIDIVDVLHGILRMRFSLSETVPRVPVPMAIDSSGRFIFLITNQGLTIVDLGSAPLSIGWLNAATASVGAQVTIRGSGFNSSTTATVGGEAASVNVSDENTLTLTIPNISSGPASIVLTNADGTSYTGLGLLTVQ
ncbi:MAG TPA: IPT/TIG domain-containing protein [Candidatus Acidoferrum sp.]|nr:IPT/TIG domain-containing protein [Candidatus Acidoferrum sp.]